VWRYSEFCGGPLSAQPYHDPAYIAQVQTDYIAGPEELFRGVVFVLVLLPVLAVIRGRGWPDLLRTAAYIALIDAALEAWRRVFADRRNRLRLP
jgi:hypothetical protein